MRKASAGTQASPPTCSADPSRGGADPVPPLHDFPKGPVLPRLSCLILAAALTATSPVLAGDDIIAHPTDGDYEDALFGVESAILDRGLVIDYVSHVGEMLARTGADVGSDVVLFDQAQVFLFCSAQLSREMMEADPMNIGHCPYGVFVADRAGEVVIGYRSYPDGPMQAVQTLLSEIAEEAASF